MLKTVIADPWALQQHYILQEGFVFTSCSLNVKTVSKDVYAGHIKTHMAVRE